ncbi:MAG: sugar kinase [Geodermatophilaceae bacterium]|nr:sugar kinase [Geodermatophilaceae bacterium]
MTRVVVVGDIAVDVVATMSAPVARGSDSPARIRYAAGGAGANVAAWLADLDVSVALIGRVGADDAGRSCLAGLTAAGVQVVVAIDPEATTGTVIVLVDPDGERSMIPDRGANLRLEPADVDERFFARGIHLHLSGYPLLDAGSRAAALHALALARGAGMTISVDPASTAPILAFGTDRFLAATEGVDLLLPNRAEAELLTGREDSGAAAVELARRYGAVVVTCGAQGAVWAAGGESGLVPALPARVVDTTGAGDAFTAGLLASWLAAQPLPDCVLAGTRAAARAVGLVGAQPR